MCPAAASDRGAGVILAHMSTHSCNSRSMAVIEDVVVVRGKGMLTDILLRTNLASCVGREFKLKFVVRMAASTGPSPC